MNQKGYARRASRVAARRLGDEVLVMSIENAAFVFSLNKVAALIWEAADGVTPTEEIVRRICARFEVNTDVALKDALELFGRLAQHGILHLSDSPITGPEASAPE
jgi:phosphohistidine swiveling domain-containing protein